MTLLERVATFALKLLRRVSPHVPLEMSLLRHELFANRTLDSQRSRDALMLHLVGLQALLVDELFVANRAIERCWLAVVSDSVPLDGIGVVKAFTRNAEVASVPLVAGVLPKMLEIC